jgi:RNA polymerase primary sigma factor
MSKSETTSKEPLQCYLNEIAKIPLLTVIEERGLGARIKAGEEQAIQTLVASNLRFVVKVAKKYRRFGVPFLDLINEGNLGLIQAARRFDPDREIRFISYAVWWIRQAILSLLANMGHPIRLPVKINYALHKLRLAAISILEDTGEKPMLHDMAEKTGFSTEEITKLLSLNGSPLSLDQPSGDGDRTLESTLPNMNNETAEGLLLQEAFSDEIRSLLLELKDKERLVLSLRFGLIQEKCYTLKQIGEKIGVSRERVRQIQEKALEKLRRNRRAIGLIGSSFAA